MLDYEELPISVLQTRFLECFGEVVALLSEIQGFRLPRGKAHEGLSLEQARDHVHCPRGLPAELRFAREVGYVTFGEQRLNHPVGPFLGFRKDLRDALYRQGFIPAKLISYMAGIEFWSFFN